MQGRQARMLASLFAALVVALSIASSAFATAADPNAIVKLRQPDGRSFLAHIWGDEYIHGYEALNGRTVLKDPKTGFWRYAERGLRGTLEVSDAVVTRDRPAFGRHLRPAPSRFTAVRAREQMPPVGKPLLQAAPDWAGDDTDILFIMVGSPMSRARSRRRRCRRNVRRRSLRPRRPRRLLRGDLLRRRSSSWATSSATTAAPLRAWR